MANEPAAERIERRTPLASVASLVIRQFPMMPVHAWLVNQGE
jgi:hypothetical protein